VAVCHAFGVKLKARVASLLPDGVYTIPEIIRRPGDDRKRVARKEIGHCVGRARYETNNGEDYYRRYGGMLEADFCAGNTGGRKISA